MFVNAFIVGSFLLIISVKLLIRGRNMDKFDSKKIKELRVLNNITQKQLGDLLGISDRAVSKWESGLSKPSGQNLISLAKVFNVPVESFFENSLHLKTKRESFAGGMESLTELYKIGRGPSSSHTIGPEKACLIFKNKIKVFIKNN